MSQLARAMTEDELLQAITEAATLYGWRWTHTRRSDKAQIMGHAGVPDLLLVREGRVLFFELKSEKGITTPDQRTWLDRLSLAEGVVAVVIRPGFLDAALAMLQ